MKMLAVFLLSFFIGVAVCEDDEAMTLVCCTSEIITFMNDYCRKVILINVVVVQNIVFEYNEYNL